MHTEIRQAVLEDNVYATAICNQIEESAKVRGTGIAKRDPEYIRQKIKSGDAVIAFVDHKIAGFSYIETFQEEKFVVNSGLIVFPEYRKMGLSRKIKSKIFKLSRQKFPKSKIFSITTNLAVMKMNTDLGFKPVTFNQLTESDRFWKGCQSCKNYDILMRNERKMCLCTGLLFDPEQKKEGKIKKIINKWRKK